MPDPANIESVIYNVYDVEASSNLPLDTKLLAVCSRCPLSRQRFVGGRGGDWHNDYPSGSIFAPFNGANLACSSCSSAIATCL
jgi:hypothetical protein